MRSWYPRLLGLIVALVLGYVLFQRVRSAWTNYWLLEDGREGMAVLTKEHWAGRGLVVYEYSFQQKQYTGVSKRNWKDEKYRNVSIGGKSAVYFSSSHPWLSLLHKPDVIVEGLPFLLIVLVFEFFALVTIIKPKSGWAFDMK